MQGISNIFNIPKIIHLLDMINEQLTELKETLCIALIICAIALGLIYLAEFYCQYKDRLEETDDTDIKE